MKTPRLLRPRLLLLRPSRAQRVYADISSLSCAPDVKEVVSGALDPDFDAVGSDSDVRRDQYHALLRSQVGRRRRVCCGDVQPLL